MRETTQSRPDTERDFARREVYTRPQLAWPLTVSEYRLSEEAGARMCLVRFVCHEAVAVNTLTLTVIMLDASGAEIERRDVTFYDAELPRVEVGASFVPGQAIAVDRRCAEVILDIREVVSGDYRYRAAGRRVVPDYCPAAPWRYDASASAEAGLSDTTPLRVRSGRARRVRGLWPIAALGFLLLMFYLLSPLFSTRGGSNREYALFAATCAAEPLGGFPPMTDIPD